MTFEFSADQMLFESADKSAGTSMGGTLKTSRKHPIRKQEFVIFLFLPDYSSLFKKTAYFQLKGGILLTKM